MVKAGSDRWMSPHGIVIMTRVEKGSTILSSNSRYLDKVKEASMEFVGSMIVGGFVLLQIALLIWFISMVIRLVRAVETIAENSRIWVAPNVARKEMTAEEVIRRNSL
jgi:hypothetical protein